METRIQQSSTTLARLWAETSSARRIADILAESLAPEDAVAVFETGDGRWCVEIHFARAPEENAVRALLAEVAGEAAADALAFETIAPRDWIAQSLAGLKPVAAGRFLVHGAHDRARVAANRIAIEIEAALAFGTGHHGTTRGCLVALDEIVKRASKRQPVGHLPLKGGGEMKTLDLGTGTGVLAIAAAKALHRPVLAGDIDRRAVHAAKDNARKNRVGALIEVVHAPGLSARRFRERAPFDLVFANILLGPLKLLATPMAKLLAPGAHVVLSGLLPAHVNAALSAYRAHGLALARRIHLDGWVTLVLKKANSLSPHVER